MLKLRKTLLNLAIGELAACAAFIFLFIYTEAGLASLISLVFLVFMLVQGSWYWLVRYRLLIRNRPLHRNIVVTLRILNGVNLVFCIAVPIAIAVTFSSRIDLWIGLAVYLFAVIEYINYYWYRLSYGKSGFNIWILFSKKLMKSSIRKLLKKYDDGFR